MYSITRTGNIVCTYYSKEMFKLIEKYESKRNISKCP